MLGEGTERDLKYIGQTAHNSNSAAVQTLELKDPYVYK